jgi:hypothetical protein
MHELDTRREPHMSVAFIAAQARGGEGEHGAQALAARVDQMAGKLRDKLDIGPRAVEDDVVDMSHVLVDKRGERLKTRLRIVSPSKLDDNSHGISPENRPKFR